MQEENIENLDSTNPDELSFDTGATEIDVAALQETNKKLFERAKKAEAEAKALKTKQSEIINKEPTRTAGVPDEVIDLRLDGYSKEETEFILRNGGRKALEDKASFVAIALETKREQAKAEAEANKVVDTSQLTDVERKYTPEQLKAMSASELEKLLPRA